MKSIVFIDTEIDTNKAQVLGYGAIDGLAEDFLHDLNVVKFKKFIEKYEYICGHNIIHFDLAYLNKYGIEIKYKHAIDTLYLSPLLFPQQPYHNLVKDDKLITNIRNNPLNDAKKARELFYDEVNVFKALPEKIKKIYCSLLYNQKEFHSFFEFVNCSPIGNLENEIKKFYYNKICRNVALDDFINNHPIALAYALAIINIRSGDNISITPAWVLKKYPFVENIIKVLCSTPCSEGCEYCDSKLNIRKQLNKIFQYNEFRSYDGEPLQERACQAAVQNKSLIAIFPTGGGKSLTFQLPALIAGEVVRGLTVVISPLQSLMKDQIDNLEKRGIVDAVTINGLLNPIERSEAIHRVENGIASILYISPEQLRSKTIEYLLLSRHVVRFVIDEAHCFSAWGQDFRVDYLYIGDFIKKLQEMKGNDIVIPVSCFTATAKPKVIMDIQEYFKNKLNIQLELFTTNATRENLHYKVIHEESEDSKYIKLRSLIEAKECATIVYVSKVATTFEIATRLSNDGFPALPYNGKMPSKEKIENQEKFINNEVKIIVATSAFGMGVDKQDIELVVHFDVSSSLEDYMQESGRAAREQSLEADCYVLFAPTDLDKQFIWLNQTKLTMNEIQQIWQAIKKLTKNCNKRCCKSALEIAKCAGWDIEEDYQRIETRVKTALLALENAGYIMRKHNMPRVYATSVQVNNVLEAIEMIDKSNLFTEQQKKVALSVISRFMSAKYKSSDRDNVESRVDYIADSLGLEKKYVIEAINLMRQAKILEDYNDMAAYIDVSSTKSKASTILDRCIYLENYLLSIVLPKMQDNFVSLKEINEDALNRGIASTIKDLRIIFNYWAINGYIEKFKGASDKKIEIILKQDINEIQKNFGDRCKHAKFILDDLIGKAKEQNDNQNGNLLVNFSLNMLLEDYNWQNQLALFKDDITLKDIEESLFYLRKIGALNLEGGFIVLYCSMEIIRLASDNKIKYKKDDYKFLDNYYKQKIQQIHIIGEFLSMLLRSYQAAIQFVKDYFQLDYDEFIKKYFKGRNDEIRLNMTPYRYNQLIGELSEVQKNIVNDKDSQYIVVAAGPGSGKTKVLVHKLASLLTQEDIKTEQLLMLTFSRAAAIEFKKRLYGLIGPTATYVDIKTFHSYCFDLLGRVGSLEHSENIILDAVDLINSDEVESDKLIKTVLVIDEAQDMSFEEFTLVEAIIKYNEDIRVIAVGDDDQNIYEFRGSDSKYFESFMTKYSAKKYEMVANYRSGKNIVQLSNSFAQTIQHRIKTNFVESYSLLEDKVNIIKYKTKNLEEAVVNNIINHRDKGTTCVLTNTNYEALRVLGILNKKNVPAKLIQSLDGFNLYDLFEIRFIMHLIKSSEDVNVISTQTWNNIKSGLKHYFSTSSCLPIIFKMLEDFEQTNSQKYVSDLETFFNEVKFEDFYELNDSVIVVSTIHKSKGQEYDNVHMLLNNVSVKTDEDKRKIYVGMTRAKSLLNIYCNNDIFDDIAKNNGYQLVYDNNQYQEPEEIIFQLTHKDVVLDYFLNRNDAKKMRSGTNLTYYNGYLYAIINGKREQVLKLSKYSIDHLKEIENKGYKLYKAKIRFIVYWYSKKTDKDVPIILPDIYLRKIKE